MQDWIKKVALFVTLPVSMATAEMRFNFPEPVTPLARGTLHIHNEFVLIISVLFLVVFAIMVYSMMNHRKGVNLKPSTFTGPVNRKQWLWTLFPFAVLLFIDGVILGIPAYHAVLEMEDTKTNAELLVKVTGSQWKWQYEYPADNLKFVSVSTTPEEQINNKVGKSQHYLLEVDKPLIIPKDRKVRLLLTSTDVIHGFWVPQFGIKRDAIPGYIRETWIKAEKTGIYRGQCSELCGKGHAYMPIVVKVVPQDEFDTWLADAKTQAIAEANESGKKWSKEELMAKGKEVYTAQCSVCHQANGQGVPPAFPPLAHSALVQKPLFSASGKMVRDTHLDRVLNGKSGTAMQAFKNTLSDVELAAVITYERNSFGNKLDDFVQPAQIKELRTVTPEEK